MTLITFVFRNLRTPKTWLDKCLKCPVSEDLSTSNMGNVPKHNWNLHHSTFIIFNDHSQVKFVWESAFSSAANVLTSSTNIVTCKILVLLVNTLAADERYPVLNGNNLGIPIQMQLSQKQKTFLQALVDFWKFILNFKSFEKKLTLTDIVFSKLRTPKTESDKFLKSAVSEDPWTSNMVNVPKYCWNLRHSTFKIFTDYCQVNWVGKGLFKWHARSSLFLLTHWLPMKGILFLKTQFNDTNSDAIISETKHFFSIFSFILEIYIKF